MRVTVLGSAASHAGESQACAGHLVEGGGARILMDCGNGVLSNLYRVADPLSLDAVFVTHNHPDHYADLYSMQAMLRYAPSGPIDGVPLYTPGNLFERMQGLLSERGSVEFRDAFDNHLLVDGESIRIADMVITPMLVDHTEPTFALRVEAEGATVAYTADTSPGAHALEAARGADLLLAEATLPEQFAGMSPHLTAGEAGELARDAGAGMLVLVHVWPTNDRFEMARTAAEAFGGQVEVGCELVSYDVIARGTAQ
jgi:ribonuclease BN (tRNA processing enzyme)